MILSSLKKEYDRLGLKGGKYLLAFSGGPDSVFLLVTLLDYFKSSFNDHIEIAYVDYHDSDEVYIEEKIVNDYICKYHLCLNRIDANCPENENFEDWARTIRYTYFKNVTEAKRLNGILVAHHLDDLIETYIIQKNRKSIPLVYGLKSVVTNNGLTIYRPLLNISKGEIYEYLISNNYPYYEDKTNKNMFHERNRLRTSKLSSVEKLNILNEISLQNSSLINLYNEFNKLNKAISFNYYDNLNVEYKKRLIFYILNRDSNINYLRIEKLSKVIYTFLNKKEVNKLHLDSSYYLCKLNDRFFISNFLNEDYQFNFDIPKTFNCNFFNVDLTKLDITLIKGYPLIIRNYKKGDIFSTDISIKDVSSFLKKHQVPSFLKNIYPVIVFNNKVVYSPFYKEILNNKSAFTLPYLAL